MGISALGKLWLWMHFVQRALRTDSWKLDENMGHGLYCARSMGLRPRARSLQAHPLQFASGQRCVRRHGVAQTYDCASSDSAHCAQCEPLWKKRAMSI
jgi:hypothetical protein